MKEKIREILSENGIYEWAVCDFLAVADHLISCRAKLRLPENGKSFFMEQILSKNGGVSAHKMTLELIMYV